MKPVQTSLTADWGPGLRRTARVVGAVAALLITLAWIAGETAYDLGRQLREALDARNDQLAAWWVGALGVASAVVPAPAISEPSEPSEPLAQPGVAPIALLPAAAASLGEAAKPAPRKRRTPAAKPAGAPAKPHAKAPKARRKVAA